MGPSWDSYFQASAWRNPDEGMKQALAALFGAVFTVAACYAAGALVLDRLRANLRRFEQIPLAFVMGAACLHLVMFAIFASHVAYKPVFWLILAIPLVVWVRRTSWSAASLLAGQVAGRPPADREVRPTILYANRGPSFPRAGTRP